MKKKILITSALPYANGPLHFGHIAGAYLPADCYARFERLRGSDVLFICGSDEYGVAIAMSAELAKRSPREHVDLYHELIQGFFNKLHIQFDHYSRTTNRFHIPLVQKFFIDLVENGYAEERETEQLYSEKDKKFLADRYVMGTCPRCGFDEARGDECGKCGASYEAVDLQNPRSKMSGAPLILKKTKHWFLLLDQFKEKLENFLKNRPWRPNVINFAKSYIDEIRPRAITRDLEWGVPVPLHGSQGKVFYVWFDAPIGYISATQEWADQIGKPDAWKDFWLNEQVKYVQFCGKDNIPFHAVFFPAMIMGQSIPYKLVDDLVASEFYNLEGRQFSKSEGWMIDLDDFFRRFHPDQIRYAIAANAPEMGDSEFTWKDFQSRCNAELLGKFGNLINRVLVFAQNHCHGKMPEVHDLEEIDNRFLNDLQRLGADIEEHYSSYRLRKAAHTLMEIAQRGNIYFDAKMPWKDSKEDARRPSMETTIALCIDCIKQLAIFAYPIIPDTAQRIWAMLGFEDFISDANWNQALSLKIRKDTRLPKPTILFQKIEDEVIDAEIAKLKEMNEKALMKKEPPLVPLKNNSITIDDFKKIDLRVGLIKKAEKVPKSKKLLQLEIDIGNEVRTVLSGISEHYSPEEMVGKKVIVVANLEPVKLMGIESRGMVLVGTLDSSLELVTLENLPAGSEIT